MDKLFLEIINMSITSSYVILVIIVVRLFLKKIPKIFSYGLWGIAFFRLVFPFSFESIFSLISINTKAIPENIAYTQTPQIQSGFRVVDGAVNRALPAPVVGASVNPMQIWISIGTAIWITGLVLLLTYSVLSTIKLSKNLKSANLLHENIYEVSTIKTPFVFGLINPKIYLPNDLAENEKSYIIRHEKTHIKRKDHIIKFVAFFITSIHWFNPMIWLAFYLMGEDMELSCDESVIREMGYGIKKDYTSSLLSLSVGKRIIGGSPIAFGENNIKGRIKNILNYKRPKFWITLTAIIVIVILAVGLLSNPPGDEDVYKQDETNLSDKETLDDYASDLEGIIRGLKTVEDYAKEYISREIKMYESADVKIIEQEITMLEKLSSFDNILSSPIELWILDYRLKPENPDKVILAGGLEMVDGWLIDFGITGKPHLTFTYENDNLIYLGNANAIEFDLDTLASQETAIRIMLESMGLLPNETYDENHIVIKFPLSTGETSQLLLSQPVIQGSTGIWAVERWMDGNGTIYHVNPHPDVDLKIEDYYKEVQEQVKNGQNTWLLDPIQVGYDYIINSLGQILVKSSDLVVIKPATVEDFLITPESHYIGYITMMTLDERLFHLDRVEFLTLEDEERALELGLDMNYDMPSGFYIYNKDSYPTSLDLSDDTEYLILDWYQLSNHLSLTKKEFIKYNENLNHNPLYHVYTKDGYVIRIVEQYIP